jgi:hypothetical protein
MLPLFSRDTVKNGFFRCSLSAENATALADILNAANFFGIRFLSANTLPIDKTDTKACFNLTFDIHSGDLYPFLLYLAAVTPQYTPIGIYSHIKQKG